MDIMIKPRRPYDDDEQGGYLESDRDFLDNNHDLAVWLLENLEAFIGTKKAEALEQIHRDSRGAVTVSRGTLLDEARAYRRQAEALPDVT